MRQLGEEDYQSDLESQGIDVGLSKDVEIGSFSR